MADKFFEGKSLEQFANAVQAHFEEFHEQREDIDEVSEVSDWMYKGGTARGEYDKQKRKWVPRFVDGKSNVGSGLWHRQVNTRAGMLGAILLSGRELWKYRDKRVEGNPMAEETGVFRASVLNAYAQWVQKQDEFGRKLAEFCTGIYKDGNVPAMIVMKEEKRDVLYAEDEKVGESIDSETGEVRSIYSKRLRAKNAVAFRYPSLVFPYPRNVYCDKYISDMRDQECVIVLSLTSKHRLMADPKLDQEAVAQINSEDMAWDGAYGATAKKSAADNLDREMDVSTNRSIMLRWDVWKWCPVNGKEWCEPEA